MRKQLAPGKGSGGRPGPQPGTRAVPHLGTMRPQEQSRFEVFALVEIGYHEPESNANKRSICFLMKINSQIFFPFHYSLRCHVLLHDRSIYFCLQLQCLLFHSRIFYNYNRSFLQLHCYRHVCNSNIEAKLKMLFLQDVSDNFPWQIYYNKSYVIKK